MHVCVLHVSLTVCVHCCVVVCAQESVVTVCVCVCVYVCVCVCVCVRERERVWGSLTLFYIDPAQGWTRCVEEEVMSGLFDCIYMCVHVCICVWVEG